jgi:hypothetical protein
VNTAARMEAAGRPGVVLLHPSAVAQWVRERAAAAGSGPAAAGLPALRVVECKGKPPQLAADFDCAAGRFVSESLDSESALPAPTASFPTPLSAAPAVPGPCPQPQRRIADADTRGSVDAGWDSEARGPSGRRGTADSWNEAWGPAAVGVSSAEPSCRAGEPGPPSAGPVLVCRPSLRRLGSASSAGRAATGGGGPAQFA